MRALDPSTPPGVVRRAFTLLELLVVVAILATLAGGVVLTLGGAQEQAVERIAHHELNQLKAALLRFKADTGYLPRQGPFGLTTTPGGFVPVPTPGAAWFHHPANLSQLFENPLLGTGHPLERWNPDTGRGWNGPYLPRSPEGQVVVADGMLQDGTAGDLDSGTLFSDRFPALADPFVAPPFSSGAARWWTGDGSPLSQQGRPFVLFDLDDPDRARAVCLGPDGSYTAITSATFLVQPGSDDIGAYLLR